MNCKFRHIWVALFFFGWLTAWTVAPAFAQSPTTGQIAGVVKDPSGAVVSGAKVTLTNSAGAVREATTDGNGRYSFPSIEPGQHELRVDASGFAAATSTAVPVRITETTTVDFQLVIAGSQQSVKVVAEPTLVQESPTQGRVIGETQVNQLPLPTRNYTQLLALSPGTVSSLPNNAELGRGDADINVSGQRSTSNNVIIDGTEVNSPGTNSTPSLSVPAPDAIQEFILQTSLYDATQGRNSGGNVALVTKSGSNEFHGNIYEFFRNNVLNANDFFLNRADESRPVLKRNQFGGTLGGPIIHDKTFFFISYQGTRERNGTSPTSSLGFLNIPADLTNDRSTATLNNLATAYGVALNPVSQAILQAQLPGGQFAIPSAANGSVAAPPNTTTATPVSGVSRFTEDQFNLNISQQITSTNKLTGKFFFSNDPEQQAIFSFLGANPFEVPGYGGDISFHNRNLSLADTQILGPHLVNEARFGFSRIRAISSPQEPFTNQQFGITSNPFAAEFPGMATIEVAGLFTIGSSPLADEKSVVQTWQAQDMLSYTVGRHFIRVGGEFRRYDIDFFFHSFSRGEILFNSFADFLAGGGALTAPDVALLGAGVPDRGFRASDGAGFVQDDIHVTSNLTINAGLRLDHFGGYSEIRDRISEFNPAAFGQNTLPCTLLAPCTQGLTFGSSGGQLNPSKFNVSPRVGFAWSPTQLKNVVVRGGFGIYDDRYSSRFANLQVFNYPSDTVAVGLISAGFFATPFPNLGGFTFPLAPTAPSPIPLFFDGAPFPVAQNPINGFYPAGNLKTPYAMQYNLGVQWSPANTWLVDIGYVGSTGRHLLNLFNFNQGTDPSTAPFTASGFSTNKQLFGFDQVQTEASSSYNSLQASLTKRFNHGLQFLASYTYAHSIDNNSGNNNVGAESELIPLPGDQQNLHTQFGSSDFDRTHRFVFSGVYDLPKFYHGDSRLVDAAANGWQTSGIVVLQTGLPYTVVCSDGSSLNNRADLTGAPIITSSGSTVNRLNDYFNAAAFVTPTATTSCGTNAAPFGDSPRNFLRGPGQKNVDFSIVKFFRVTERSKLEFRSEFFNIFNLVNFAQPNNNAFVPETLGTITATNAGPRIIQFALKYNF
jgi:carboxypeptidase family protein/TonB-dependent receptor-like protein